MVGVVDNLLVDRAYLEQRRDAALELASINDVRPQAPHNSMRWPQRRLPGPTGCIRARFGQAFVTSNRRRIG